MRRAARLDCADVILLVLSTHASFCWIWLGVSYSVRYVYACVVLLDMNSQCVILLDLSAQCVILLDLSAHALFCWTWVRMHLSAGLECAYVILLNMRHSAGLEWRMRHSANLKSACVILQDMTGQWACLNLLEMCAQWTRVILLDFATMRERHSAWQKYQVCESRYSIDLIIFEKLDLLHAFRRRRKAHIF